MECCVKPWSRWGQSIFWLWIKSSKYFLATYFGQGRRDYYCTRLGQFSVAITKYDWLNKLWRIEVCFVHSCVDWKSKSMVLASGQGLPVSSQLGREHRKPARQNPLLWQVHSWDKLNYKWGTGVSQWHPEGPNSQTWTDHLEDQVSPVHSTVELLLHQLKLHQKLMPIVLDTEMLDILGGH